MKVPDGREGPVAAGSTWATAARETVRRNPRRAIVFIIAWPPLWDNDRVSGFEEDVVLNVPFQRFLVVDWNSFSHAVFVAQNVGLLDIGIVSEAREPRSEEHTSELQSL